MNYALISASGDINIPELQNIDYKGLKLIGRNTPNWNEPIQQNFIKLMDKLEYLEKNLVPSTNSYSKGISINYMRAVANNGYIKNDFTNYNIFDNNNDTLTIEFTLRGFQVYDSIFPISIANSSSANGILINIKNTSGDVEINGKAHALNISQHNICDGGNHNIKLFFDKVNKQFKIILDDIENTIVNNIDDISTVFDNHSYFYFGQEQDSFGGSLDSSQAMAITVFNLKIYNDNTKVAEWIFNELDEDNKNYDLINNIPFKVGGDFKLINN